MRVISMRQASGKYVGPAAHKNSSPWKLGGLSPITLGKRVWHEMDDDNIFGRAAELSYYFLLALFPMLLFLVSLLGLFAGKNPQFQSTLFDYLARLMPSDASGLVDRTLREITTQTGGWKMILGLVGALWVASGGISALGSALNSAYHVREGRPWWRSRLTYLSLTVAVAGLIIAALAIVLFGDKIAVSVGAHLHLGNATVVAWKIVQWPLALFFVVFCFALIYFYTPDLKDQSWYWITPGSVVGVLLWIAASAGFKVYLHNFNTYSRSYGSLAGVIVLMTWFYLTGLSLLVGGEINSEIEHAAAEHGRLDAKAEGEKKAPAA